MTGEKPNGPESLPLDRQVERWEKAANMIYLNTAGMGSDPAFRAKTAEALGRLAETAKDDPALSARVEAARALIASQERKEAA